MFGKSREAGMDISNNREIKRDVSLIPEIKTSTEMSFLEKHKNIFEELDQETR